MGIPDTKFESPLVLTPFEKLTEESDVACTARDYL